MKKIMDALKRISEGMIYVSIILLCKLLDMFGLLGFIDALMGDE